MINNRCCNILLLLVKADSALKMKEIASDFSISERAVRYDLDEIDRFLLKNDFGVLTRKSNSGITFDLEEGDRAKLFKCILNEREGTFFDTPKARLIDILINLTMETQPVFIDGESDRLMLSRSTVFKDFEKLRQLLNKEEMFLESGVAGFKLVGNEIALRVEIAKVMVSLLEPRDIVEIVNFISGKEDYLFSIKIAKLFEGIDIERLRFATNKIFTSLNKKISDTLYVAFVMAIAVSIKRRVHIHIDKKKEISKEILEITEIIYGYVEEKEKYFIDYLVSYIDSVSSIQTNDTYFPDLQVLSFSLISTLTKSRYHLKSSKKLLSKVSEEIIDILFSDIKSSQQPHIVEAMQEEKELTAMIKSVLKPIEETLKRDLTDLDISKLFRLLYEEVQIAKKGVAKKKVLVLCPFDKSYSSYVCERIRSNFDVEVFEGKSIKDIEKDIKENNIEIVISTIKLNLPSVTTIKISSALSEEDYDNFKDTLPLREVDTNTLKDIHQQVKKYLKANKAKNLTREIGKILNVPVDFIFQEERNFKTIFSVNRIALDYMCKDYKEALTEVGDMLYKDGHVKEGYAKAIIEEVEESRFHMVVGDGIVLAHTKETDLVNSLGVAIIRLKNKIPFINENDEKCHLIFGISLTDSESHLDVLEEISRVLLDEKSYQVLLSSNDSEEIYNLFVREYDT